LERSIELVEEGAERGAFAAPLPAAERRSRAHALDRAAVLALALLFACGLALRLAGISELGFAEDEINKLEAVRAYARGDITPNAEHPMLMKTLIFVSVSAAGAWNASAPASLRVTDEAALRFPNVFFGALTVLPFYLLAAALFDRRTGLVAAALWAFGVAAVTYNRVAKEDTLLVFFMLAAFHLYVRAKQTSGFDERLKRRFYLGSAVSFGLMFASKYFPHYFGLNMLYHHFARFRERAPGEPPGRTPPVFYLVALAAFLVANPSILLPQTWNYLNSYSSEQLLTHHGYLFGDALYPNQISSTPFGTPVYFYLLFLAIKTPLAVLLATLAGLWVCARRWREPGPLFLLLMTALWIVPYSLMGAKWLRYTLSLMPFVYMLAAVGITTAAARLSRLARDKIFFSPGARARDAGEGLPARAASLAVLLVFVAWPAWVTLAARPHYALYTNALGRDRAGHFFPHDEFYDDGLREAVQFVARSAPRGAAVVHETPGVVRHYLEKFGRADIEQRVLSAPDFRVADAPRPAYFILQRGRTYFENRDKMTEVRASFPKVYEGVIGGATAVEVYEAR
jgi:Dolichyl-phosphate-mannose-protein mannosyltransferase